MDSSRFDRLTRTLATLRSRRGITSALGLVMLAIPDLVDAKKKKRKKKKKKAKFNDFDCVNVGNFCKNSGQCCSGICEGKKGKKRCQAHDASTCQAGQTPAGCGGVDTACTTASGEQGACTTTTGNAGYCMLFAQCFACQQDADCVPFCGQQAACITCVGPCATEVGTQCAGINGAGCEFP